MKKITLLGVWNQPPLIAWPWFADKGVSHFYKLTGYHIESFTFVKDDLHHQHFLSSDIDKIKKYIDGLSEKKQVEFVEKICNDYYNQAKKAESFFKKIEKKSFSKLTNSELAGVIKEWGEILPLTSLQIWFVVLLDIWYPGLEEQKKLKSIGLKARNNSAYLHDHVEMVIKKVFSEVAKRIFLKGDEICYLFPEEILSAFSSRDYSSASIKERKELCVTTNISGKYSIYEGKEASRLFNGYIPKEKPAKGNLLSGSAASPGKVSGRVRIVLKDEEFENFKEGEILVAFQTMVDYVPIMKKAKAILTQYGGITSHAAIVSRELKKPCIVGISGLTSSVVNGDLVEVDANKGIVKILKKTS